MRFDCGPTKAERLANKIRRNHIAEEQRKIWTPFFAWWPRRVGPHDCRWLETIERRCVSDYDLYRSGEHFPKEYTYISCLDHRPAWQYRPLQWETKKRS